MTVVSLDANQFGVLLFAIGQVIILLTILAVNKLGD